MKLTKSELTNIIREVITEMAIEDKTPTKGGHAEHQECVKQIVRMIRELDDPDTQFYMVEFKARDICREMGVRFEPAYFEALDIAGVE